MKYFPLRSISVMLVISRIWKSFSVDPPPEVGHRNGKSWRCFGRAGLLEDSACGPWGLGAGTGGRLPGPAMAVVEPVGAALGWLRGVSALSSLACWWKAAPSPSRSLTEFWVTNPSWSCSQREWLRANVSYRVRAPSWCWAWSSVVTLAYTGS